MQKTGIVVPCYNEAGRLNTTAFLEYLPGNETVSFIFVNDGSSDGTLEKIMLMCSAMPDKIYCVNLEKNSGKSEAVRQGVLKALEMGFENIGYWDADLATPLNAIGEFCEILEDSKIVGVIGSRVRLLGRRIERRAARHYLGRMFATFASLILGLPVYDTQCGAKIFKKTDELQLVFKRPFVVNWSFDVELLARYNLLKKIRGTAPLSESMVEYPLKEWADVKGSKIKFKDFYKLGGGLLLLGIFLRVPLFKKRYIRLLDVGNALTPR